MNALRRINTLRKAGGEFDPVALGKAIMLGILLPVSALTVIISVFSVVLAMFGIDPTYLIVTCIQEMLVGLVPIVKVLAGLWVTYCVLYFVIAFAATSAMRSLPAVPIAWIYAGSALLRMHSRALRVWQCVVAFSSTLIYALLSTDPLSTFVDDGLPPHLSTGWRASSDPSLA